MSPFPDVPAATADELRKDRAAPVHPMAETKVQREAGGIGARRGNLVYRHRFSAREKQARATTWRILCRDFLQRRVGEDGTVLDLGAGDGLFITNIRARRRIAVDVVPDVKRLASRGIEVIQAPALEIARAVPGPVDVVFMSNFLEHLPSSAQVLQVLEACHAVLAPRGRLLILQPNIRFTGAAYWDYIDHHVALTEKSLVEAVEISGFAVEELIPRFLPYTARSFAGRFAALTGLYLRLPILWRIFGAQTFLAARRADGDRNPGPEAADG